MIDKIKETLGDHFFPTSKFKDDFKNPVFQELRELLCSIERDLVELFPAENYRSSVNVGKGKIAAVPWIGIHSNEDEFDSSAQTGVYITLLWQ